MQAYQAFIMGFLVEKAHELIKLGMYSPSPTGEASKGQRGGHVLREYW